MIQAYAEYKAAGGLENGCRLCEVPAVKTYKFWKISTPKFPFDKIAQVHDMLLPIRHTDEHGLTEEEKAELLLLKHSDEIQEKYEFMIEATHNKKSIPAHFHLHMMVPKE